MCVTRNNYRGQAEIDELRINERQVRRLRANVGAIKAEVCPEGAGGAGECFEIGLCAEEAFDFSPDFDFLTGRRCRPFFFFRPRNTSSRSHAADYRSCALAS